MSVERAGRALQHISHADGTPVTGGTLVVGGTSVAVVRKVVQCSNDLNSSATNSFHIISH